MRFANDPRQPVAELMTKAGLVTVRESVGQDEAKRLLHQHRIEKLIVVDAQYRCVGLITVKDIEKAVANPHACKDEQGRLRVAAATTVGEAGFARTERLTPEKATAIRMAALCLAAEADGMERQAVGDQFRQVAAGITFLQHRLAAKRQAAEVIMLAVE